MIQADTHFSWLREVLVPAIFVLIGSVLGFLAGQISDDRKAMHAKRSFLRAIGMELDALGNQLGASLQEVNDSAARAARGGSAAPRFAGALRTSVFTSQLEKLRDVADPLMIEVIHFYSDLGTLQQAFEIVNELGAEYNRAHVPSGDKESIRPQLESGLRVLQEHISAFIERRKKLRAKLPAA